MAYEPGQGFDPKDILTADDLLAALRGGRANRVDLKIGDREIPVRFLNADEEAKIVTRAASIATKNNPSGANQKVFESYENMKQILFAAGTIDGVPGLMMEFINALDKYELADLYDQYVTKTRMINPSFQSLPPERVLEIVEAIKKKQTQTSDLFTWELAGIGRYFLEEILPALQTANDAGSPS